MPPLKGKKNENSQKYNACAWFAGWNLSISVQKYPEFRVFNRSEASVHEMKPIDVIVPLYQITAAPIDLGQQATLLILQRIYHELKVCFIPC